MIYEKNKHNIGSNYIKEEIDMSKKSKSFKKVFGDGKMKVQINSSFRIPTAPPTITLKDKKHPSRSKRKKELKKMLIFGY